VFLRCIPDIWGYILDNLAVKNREWFFHETLWDDDIKTVSGYIFAVNNNILIAEDLRLTCTDKLAAEFLYWKYKGNSQLIVEEMHEALSQKSYELKDNQLGLKWLVKKLNRSRPTSHQIDNII
jgi:hypothetical protein